MGLVAIQKLGRNQGDVRLWIESQRLENFGFSPGTPLHVQEVRESLTLRPAILGENHVSSRAAAGRRRPIIDLANQSLLAGLARYSEIKIIASYERIEVTPSKRAFAIHQSRSLKAPLRVLEVFTGGGTLTAALDSRFEITAGVEINPDYADEWQGKHEGATLFKCDLRAVQAGSLPDFDVLIGGIPCTSHSNLGRAKMGLAGEPELGDTGDLFLPVVTLISERMPTAVVFENVPAFASSLAGELLVSHLSRIGYHVSSSILRPNDDWGELEDRRRWLMVGTLDKPFALRVPGERSTKPLSAFLDPPDPMKDELDATRIAKTIKGLLAHNARHQDAGHGFDFTVMDGSETSLPTVPKSYHKINTGPFVQTAFGPRLLRQGEIERIHGCELRTRHYATAVQILGQGVLTRLFRQVFEQLSAHLLPDSPMPSPE